MDKTTTMRLFNTLFFQFIDFMISIFPEQTDIQHARVVFENIKKNNPSLLIKIWDMHIYGPYRQAIDEENIDFFIHKNYNTDISKLTENESAVSKFINNIRRPLLNMDEEYKRGTMRQLLNLSKLAVIYREHTVAAHHAHSHNTHI